MASLGLIRTYIYIYISHFTSRAEGLVGFIEFILEVFPLRGQDICARWSNGQIKSTVDFTGDEDSEEMERQIAEGFKVI